MFQMDSRCKENRGQMFFRPAPGDGSFYARVVTSVVLPVFLLFIAK